MQRGVYVTFKSSTEGKSADTRILRALHKSIAKKYYHHFQSTLEGKTREKYAEIIAQEPPDVKQISPISCHWRELAKEEEPQNVLYRRKPGKSKDEDEEGDDDGPPGKQPLKKKPKTASAGSSSTATGLEASLIEQDGGEIDEDDGASEPQSMPRVPSVSPNGGAGGINFFASTPGMVTVDLAEWKKLNAFYYSHGGR